ncbi:MAG: HlyD family efflux transporter periplasmic adaptor subunit, partial [Lysobacterales bacterium]
RTLLTLMDTSTVWAELAIFPADLARVRAGARVQVSATLGDIEQEGEIARLGAQAGPNQARSAVVELDNADGRLAPGTHVQGEIRVAEHAVPLAVKRDGLQSFRDFTVVYARIGEEYEVRMLDLGRQDETWVEVLGGLEPGTVYVTANSYLVKADIEKSGASHDH